MPETLAFDVYGTLADPLCTGSLLERHLPERGARVAEVWRRKQLEYTFRLAAMERYEDFEEVTRRALDYALVACECELEAERKRALLAHYDELQCFADAGPGLERLREAGCVMIVFSNGTPRMLGALLDSAGLRACFHDVVSVDEVRTYKPSPRTYRHAARRLGLPVGEVRLVSSNPFDCVGAEAAGMPYAWVDRSGGPFDTLGSPPETAVGSLTELADALEAGQG